MTGRSGVGASEEVKSATMWMLLKHPRAEESASFQLSKTNWSGEERSVKSTVSGQCLDSGSLALVSCSTLKRVSSIALSP